MQFSAQKQASNRTAGPILHRAAPVDGAWCVELFCGDAALRRITVTTSDWCVRVCVCVCARVGG